MEIPYAFLFRDEALWILDSLVIVYVIRDACLFRDILFSYMKGEKIFETNTINY